VGAYILFVLESPRYLSLRRSSRKYLGDAYTKRVPTVLYDMADKDSGLNEASQHNRFVREVSSQSASFILARIC
jgi:hypothetical protein